MKRLSLYIVSVFVLLPLLAVIYLSVVSQWTFPELLDAEWTLEYWKNLLSGKDKLASSFLLSIGISSFLAVGATLFGFVVSKALLFDNKLGKLVKLAFYPYIIAPVVLGVMLHYYFLRLGLSGTVFGVVVAQSLFVLPYSVLLFSTFWSNKIKQLAFQASTLGANSQVVNREIILPIAKPWFALSLLQCFLISWFEFPITRFIGVGKVETLTIMSMHYLKEANPHQAALAACLMVLPILGFLLYNQKTFAKRVAQ